MSMLRPIAVTADRASRLPSPAIVRSAEIAVGASSGTPDCLNDFIDCRARDRKCAATSHPNAASPSARWPVRSRGWPGHQRGATAKIEEASIRSDAIALTGLKRHGLHLPLCRRAPDSSDRGDGQTALLILVATQDGQAGLPSGSHLIRPSASGPNVGERFRRNPVDFDCRHLRPPDVDRYQSIPISCYFYPNIESGRRLSNAFGSDTGSAPSTPPPLPRRTALPSQDLNIRMWFFSA